MTNKKVIIIGSGPAGITASIYLKRSGMEPYLIESYMPGGKLSSTYKIDNYPGFDSINGSDLAFKMMDQLTKNQIDIHYETVTSVIKKNDKIIVESSVDSYQTEAVIIASGMTEKKLNIKSEDKFLAKGISFCAICDGGFYKNQPMAIIGGGNSALEEALYLKDLANPLYIIHRRNEFRGDQLVLDQVKESDKIKIMTPYVPVEFKGEEVLDSLVLENVETKEQVEINVKGVFEYVGSIPNTSFVNNKEILNEQGFIEVDDKMMSKIPGIFAAGDVIKKDLRQVVTATNDGAIAAMVVKSYLK